MNRARKEALVNELNPQWRFLNEEILGNWPPTEEQMDEVRQWLEQNQL